VIQGLDNRRDELRLIAFGHASEFRYPHRRDALDDNSRWLGGFALDGAQPRLDLSESRAVGRYLLLQLGLPQPQHAAQLSRADVFVQGRGHLLQGEAQVLQGDNPVQPGELGCFVKAITGRGVDEGRLEQPDRVVMTQHPDGYPAVPGELSNGKHDTPCLVSDTVSGSSRYAETLSP
jgi:hypothetical protein